MTGLFRLIIMSVIGYIIYAVLRRFLQPLFGGAGPARGRQSQSQKRKYSPTDGAVDAEFEELD